jgi:WS/DGAT/MGAT family acyltransferase
MQPLSALDASFIYLESERSPMHIGGIYLIDAAGAPDEYGYERFRAHIRERLRCSPIFRQRLVEVPYNLSHPWWINDPDFDLDSHLPQFTLPKPGGMAELMELAGHFFSTTLDRSKPLWETGFITGLDQIEGMQSGSFAMISKVHHAAIDGGSGAELMGALLDTTPTARQLPGQDDWQPEDIPSTAWMSKHAYAQLGRKSLELGKFAGEVAGGLARFYGVQRVEKLDPPPRLLSAPKTVFNREVTSDRAFWGVEFELERIKAIRQCVPGATVNDVILAVCAGGLRSYLENLEALPDQPLVAMAPISVRTEAQKGKMGNQVSAMLVNLNTDVVDPLQRLQGIMRNTRSSKLYSNALPANRIAEFIPSETAALATRLYTRTRLGGYHRPFFNLVITNVPGPPIPLYLAGARITSHFGMAPVIDGLGLLMVVFSYAGMISIGLLACRDVLPDPQRLGAFLEDSLAHLEAAVSRVEAEPSAKAEEVAPERKRSENTMPASEALEQLRQASRDLEEAMQNYKPNGSS